MRFGELAAVSAAVGATTKRLAKVEALAAALARLQSDDPGEVEAGAAYLAGDLRQRQVGVGWAALQDLPAPAAEARLTVTAVDAALGEIGAQSGPGSQARRRQLLGALFAAATAPEQAMLRGLLSGELRQGAQAGLLVDAIARAAGIDAAAVRRALLFSGDLKAVAVAALAGGAAALAAIGLRVGRPLTPMLAQPAPSIADAIEATGLPAVVDAKLDGIRIQVHKNGDDVTVFTRSLDDITARVPGVVAAVRTLPAEAIVLDGEAITLGPHGRPEPFQETSSRAARRARAGPPARGAVAPDRATPDTPALVPPRHTGAAGAGEGDGLTALDSGTEGAHLQAYFFDLLHLDGRDLVDEPGRVRWQMLAEAVPERLRVQRVTVSDVAGAQAASEAALAAGHEGVVVKALGAGYDVGRRGNAWIKVKPRHTLDLVVLAVEWGHGRRAGLLSNLHLGARDPDTDTFVMLGKTFKGMTDEMLRWQTRRFTELAVGGTDGWVVRVRPEQVVEVAFDGVQTSPRYPGGVALRFARVLRYRDDKRPDEADTIAAVRALRDCARGSPGT